MSKFTFSTIYSYCVKIIIHSVLQDKIFIRQEIQYTINAFSDGRNGNSADKKLADREKKMRLGNVIWLIAVGQILSYTVYQQVSNGQDDKKHIPLVYCTDLFHPHDDPDDHFDLATLFAMPELDVKVIILDQGARQKEQPGRIPLEQMFRLTGRHVPYATGLSKKLQSPDDKGFDQPKKDQKAIELLLKSLREVRDPLTVVATGSLRDLCAAYNRKPELFQEKISRIYVNIGSLTERKNRRNESNVRFDPQAFIGLMRSGLPVYWCPCLPLNKKLSTHWKLKHGEVLEDVSPALLNWFIYALQVPRPSELDPMAALTMDLRPWRHLVMGMNRSMWCTGSLIHAAGRTIYYVDGHWIAAKSPPPGGKVTNVFTFVPVRMENSEIDGMIYTTWTEDTPNPNMQLYKVTDPQNYESVLKSCLHELYKNFPSVLQPELKPVIQHFAEPGKLIKQESHSQALAESLVPVEPSLPGERRFLNRDSQCFIYADTTLAAAKRIDSPSGIAKGIEVHNKNEKLNKLIHRYSAQKIICLDIGEEYLFKLKDGSIKVIKLISIKEYRDRVIGKMRRAEIDVEVDGIPLHLTCAPYVMPTEIMGIRIQADTASGWQNISKKAQFSIWDVKDPIINTNTFGFPIHNYRLFSHGLQCYNEVVHLGRYDGDPEGVTSYHDYGIDLAGYDGRDEIISCTDGEVILLRPKKKPHNVVIRDHQGLYWHYGHLDSVLPGIKEGVKVKKGQKIGVLGKKGASGNFSHLHLGTFLSKADLDADRRNRRLNLFPWIVDAYQAQYQKNCYAVAGPHRVIKAGQKVIFDGSQSLAFKTKIVSYRWEFHDGKTVNSARAEKEFHAPGVYMATLQVKDKKGNEDVDFCRIKVFTASAPEDRIPTIFMTYHPTNEILINQPIFFRFWLQAKNDEPFRVDFGDGTVIDDYTSYTEVTHRFEKVGIHIITAETNIDGMPVTQKQKVIVKANTSK